MAESDFGLLDQLNQGRFTVLVTQQCHHMRATTRVGPFFISFLSQAPFPVVKGESKA